MSFDRLAIHYGWMETVLAGQKLQRIRTEWLNELPPIRRALLVGEGPGRFLIPLLKAQPEVEVLYLDSSPAMHREAQNAMARHDLSSSRVRWVHAELPTTLGSIEPVDLIVTHFFLDCFTAIQLPDLIAELASLATPDAHWLVADFQLPASGLARWRAKAIHRVMYDFFRLVTRLPARILTPPDASLSRNGFRLVQRTVTEWGLLHADWWRRTPAGSSFPDWPSTNTTAAEKRTSA